MDRLVDFSAKLREMLRRPPIAASALQEVFLAFGISDAPTETREAAREESRSLDEEAEKLLTVREWTETWDEWIGSRAFRQEALHYLDLCWHSSGNFLSACWGTITLENTRLRTAEEKSEHYEPLTRDEAIKLLIEQYRSNAN